MSLRRKSLKNEESLLISGINASTIHQYLDNHGKPNNSSIESSRLDLSSSKESEDPIKVQDSFSISAIYKEVEPTKENILAELYDQSKDKENSEFLKLLEENTCVNSKQKAYSKLDESSIVGENCKIVIDPNLEYIPLLKKQQKKYYKAFMILQALLISAKESTERKIDSMNCQISEVNSLIKQNLEFKNKIEAAVNSKLDIMREELLQKFELDANKLFEKYQVREDAHKNQTKDKIMLLRKELSDNEKAFRSLEDSRAKNSEDLLRKNCEMRLKIALMQAEAQTLKDN